MMNSYQGHVQKLDGPHEVTSASITLRRGLGSSPGTGPSLTGEPTWADAGVPSDLVEARGRVPAGLGQALVHFHVAAPALIARDTEAGVAVASVPAHSAVQAGAGRALVEVQLAEPSRVASGADAHGGPGVPVADAPVQAGAGPAGASAGVAAGPAVPGRTSAQRAPLARDANTRGESWTGAGEARVLLLPAVFVPRNDCV